MLSEAFQRVATLQLGSNSCSFIAIFAALSSATQKCERALSRQTLGAFQTRLDSMNRESAKPYSH